MAKNFELEKKWDRVYQKYKGKRLSVWRENASPFFTNKIDYFKHLGLKKVLDAGCGDGRNLVEFAKAGFQVTGIDISEEALNRCRKNCKKFRNVKLQKMELEKPDFKAGSFDAVICDFVMAHMEKPEKIIRNFHKLLKKDGYALIEFTSVYDPLCSSGKKIGKHEYLQGGFYLRFYTIEQMEKLMKKFTILGIDSVSYTDPNHGSGYNRKKRHNHHSYFVMAKK